MNDIALERFQRLNEYLASDPDNASLLVDVARAAMDAGKCDIALSRLEHLHGIEPLQGETANLAGIAAMRSANQAAAQKWFAIALEEAPDDASVQFNMAWSRALAGDFEGGAQLLSEGVVEALPQAAMLDMQIAHELGRFEDAAAKMDSYLAMHPDYPPLHAAASVLAMDVDRPDLAYTAAIKGGAHPDALTTLGSLSLGDQKLDEAEAHFERALASGQRNPRAMIGRGLVALSRGDYMAATSAIDTGAADFGDHLGSWIAAGWAHLLAGDVETAKARFQTALDTDDTFAEAQGSMAVIDLVEGNREKGQRGAQVAARLDPSSFSAAFAKILIANADDDPATAEKILKRAMATSILPDGKTLGQAIAQSLANGAVAGSAKP